MTPAETKIQFETWLTAVRYKDWDIKIRFDENRPYLQIGFWGYDTTRPGTKEKEYQTGRKWMLSPWMTKSELIQTAFKAVLTAEEHEIRETFRYRGKTIFGPHFNVDVLAEICRRDCLDFRQEDSKKSAKIAA